MEEGLGIQVQDQIGLKDTTYVFLYVNTHTHTLIKQEISTNRTQHNLKKTQNVFKRIIRVGTLVSCTV